MLTVGSLLADSPRGNMAIVILVCLEHLTRLRAWSLMLMFLLSLRVNCTGADAGMPPLTGDDIVQHLIEADSARRSALKNYSANRLYLAGNKNLAKSAEVAVVEYYSAPGRKQLTVVSERGSPMIVHRVLEKAIEAETESAQDGNLNQTRLTPDNYRFQLVGSQIIDARPCYVLAVTPRVAGKYLMRGQVWVDQTDFAIIRMEGSPAKNPSFWTRKPHFLRRYEKHGQFWLPGSFDSRCGIGDIRQEYASDRIYSLSN